VLGQLQDLVHSRAQDVASGEAGCDILLQLVDSAFYCFLLCFVCCISVVSAKGLAQPADSQLDYVVLSFSRCAGRVYAHITGQQFGWKSAGWPP
jgi:hypothetical protein